MIESILARTAQAQGVKHIVIALAGAPGSGKSTLAKKLVEQLNQHSASERAVVVPLDGFHLDNALLREQGLLARKGAPETFDVAGFIHLIRRIKQEDEVIFPLFDREFDKAIAGAGQIKAQHHFVVVEGNYLLLNYAAWQPLHTLWDMSIWLEVLPDELEQRLLLRWLGHGYTQEQAEAKVYGNDLANAQLVMQHSVKADYVV
ncbi:MAG: phosphoribulokinase [Proteobacteria bacterium]|nr:MAG: phosphoribulokinase [Pseudomonadota bacterium]